MPLIETVFPLNKGNDRENLLAFVRSLPTILRQFFDPETSNLPDFIERHKKTFGISKELFLSALDEAEVQLESSLNLPNYNFDDQMKLVGLTGQSLVLKATLLEALWTQLKTAVNQSLPGILNFWNGKIKELINKFLKYLNSLLGSIMKVVPGGEAFKEFKDALEGYMDLADTE